MYVVFEYLVPEETWVGNGAHGFRFFSRRRYFPHYAGPTFRLSGIRVGCPSCWIPHLWTSFHCEFPSQVTTPTPWMGEGQETF